MAARAIWRGHLRLALVSCPVALYNAKTERSSLKFNLINPTTGNRIRMATMDSETGEELARKDTVKGYEYRKGKYLLLTPDDLESVKVKSSTMMSIEKFVDAGSIDPVFYNGSYYLAPDGDAGRDVYAVLLTAIGQSHKTALARVVISQRERTIAVRASGKGLMAHTLDELRDINDAADIFGQPAASDPQMVQLAQQLIERQVTEYDPADIEDAYENRLRAMIDAKLKGEGVDISTPEEPVSNVIDLMAALKASLGAKAEAAAAAPAKKAAPKRKSA